MPWIRGRVHTSTETFIRTYIHIYAIWKLIRITVCNSCRYIQYTYSCTVHTGGAAIPGRRNGPRVVPGGGLLSAVIPVHAAEW